MPKTHSLFIFVHKFYCGCNAIEIKEYTTKCCVTSLVQYRCEYCEQTKKKILRIQYTHIKYD